MDHDGYIIKHGTFGLDQCFYALGVGILKEHLFSAASFLISGTGSYRGHTRESKIHYLDKINDMKESVLFVQGSGLEMVIRSYGIEADPDEFREAFFNWVEYQRRKRKSR